MANTTIDDFVYYRFDPSLAAAILFIVLFALLSITHSVQLIRKRTWYFVPFVVGGLFETVGYVGRALSAKETPDWSLGPYVVQALLILLAPALLAASIYMVLGRLIRLLEAESISVVRVNWLTKIFVTGDVLSFLMQSSGGGLLSKATDQAGVDMGENIITAGLGVQVLFFGLFIITTGIFNYRISRAPTHASQTTQLPWQRFLFVLYASSLLILIRSVFRIAEYIMGQDGVLLSHEYYLYIFDACLMFFTMILFNIWHPSSIISGKATKRSPSNEPVVERVGYVMGEEEKSMNGSVPS